MVPLPVITKMLTMALMLKIEKLQRKWNFSRFVLMFNFNMFFEWFRWQPFPENTIVWIEVLREYTLFVLILFLLIKTQNANLECLRSISKFLRNYTWRKAWLVLSDPFKLTTDFAYMSQFWTFSSKKNCQNVIETSITNVYYVKVLCHTTKDWKSLKKH